MENRIGVKDLFMFGLMVALLVLVVLAMVQFDRQHKDVQEIKTQNSNLTADLQRIKSRIEQGIATGGAGTGGGQPPEQLPVFKALVDAEKAPDFSRGDWLVDNF